MVNAPDGPVSYTLGNGLNVYRTYDTLGRSIGQWVCSGPAAPACSGGTQIYGTSTGWKGSQLLNQADTVLNQQVSYSYGDGFNRLTARTVTSGTVKNYTYSYDRYGNRVSQTALQGGYNFNPTINPSNNQITTSGYLYDAAGNMTNDTVHSYTYDAEGNITRVDGGSTAQYVYDVFNRRIHMQTASASTDYIYDYAGRRISSWVSPNTGTEGRIYWDGQQFGYRSSDGTTYYDHQHTVGTERIRTNYGGTVASTYLSLPWGDGYSSTVNNAGGDQDNAHFPGLERDAESGTEHAQFRNYASAQGRWLAPDPYMGSYDLNNPQSMNRYTYALNNPLSFVDPSGLDAGQDPCEYLNGVASFCVGNGPGVPSPVDGGDGGDILCWWCGEYGGSPTGVIPCTWCALPPQPSPQTPSPAHLEILSNAPSNRKYHCPLFGPCYQGPAINARQTQCTGQAIRNNALALGADSLGAIPGEGQVLAGVQLAAAGVGFVNAVATNDASGAVASVLGGQVTLVSETASELGAPLVKAIPVLGNLFSAGLAVRDVIHGIQDYQACLAGH